MNIFKHVSNKIVCIDAKIVFDDAVYVEIFFLEISALEKLCRNRLLVS